MRKYLQNDPVYYLLLMLRAGLFCLSASILTTILLERQNEAGFPGELPMIIFWSIPFAISIALAALVLGLFISPLSRIASYPLAILVGMAGGYLWERTVYLLFVNPMFGSFSIPVFFTWVAGGIAGLVSIAGLGSRAGKGNNIFEIFLAIFFVVLIGMESNDLVEMIYQSRQVNIVWIKWAPSPGGLILGPHVQDELTVDELVRIKAMKLKGFLEWKETSNLEKGPISRMVIILQQPVMKPVELKLPKESSVIYVQQLDGSFVMLPQEAPLLRRTLRIGPDPNFPGVTSGYLKIPQGTHIFGAMDWGKDPTP
jgi:hypothetical protein